MGRDGTVPELVSISCKVEPHAKRHTTSVVDWGGDGRLLVRQLLCRGGGGQAGKGRREMMKQREAHTRDVIEIKEAEAGAVVLPRTERRRMRAIDEDEDEDEHDGCMMMKRRMTIGMRRSRGRAEPEGLSGMQD